MDGDFPEDECQQATIIADPVNEAERRRFMALDQAIRIADGATSAKTIVEDARAFESYLKGE